MKLTNRDFAGKGRGAAQSCSIFFFCGPDEAGASAAANDLVSWLRDPGERVELAGADVRGDPARLGDEARTTSLFGDRRHIWIRANGEDALEALRVLIETADAGAGEACPVVVVASGASDKSRTAKLLEKRKDALVAMFYPPDLQSVTRSVRALADGAGVRLGGDLAERIARGANLDVRLAKSEVDKLALYLDASAASPQTASEADLDAIGATSEDDGFNALVNAVMGGQTAKVAGELARMKQLGLNPVGVLLAFERRAAQLARIAAALGSRPFGELDRGEEARLGIFFKEKRDIGQQFGLWRHGDKLDRLTQRLVGLHRELLTNSQAAELLLAQGLADIARVAGARAR